MKKIILFGIGILIGCIAISAGATSLSSIHSFKVSTPIKSKVWAIPSGVVIKQPIGTVLKGQNGYGVSMDECRMEINETRREIDGCYDTLHNAETSSATYSDYQSCTATREIWRRDLHECRIRHERLGSSGEYGAYGNSTASAAGGIESGTTVSVTWKDPVCLAPTSSTLRDACLGSCQNDLSIEINVLHWCRGVTSDIESYFAGRFSDCQEDVTRFQEKFNREGCTNGSIVTPPAGVSTCGATGCR